MTNKLDVPKEHARLNKQRDETIPLATKEKRLLVEYINQNPSIVPQLLAQLRGSGKIPPRKY